MLAQIVATGRYPQVRLRRNRQYPWFRQMVAENNLTTNDLIFPIFVRNESTAAEISAMPNIKRLTLKELPKIVTEIVDLNIPAIALFPSTPAALRSEEASEAFNPNNLICQAIRVVKEKTPSLGVITDVALDIYTSHGHDGLLKNNTIVNDETIEVLCRQAVVQAEAGSDIIAPSDMMDGRVGAIRTALDSTGFTDVGIMSYAAKYCSAFYGPFREAVDSNSSLSKGDKKTYQMDTANSNEALNEVALDIAEGADSIIIKPGLPYLDIVRRVKERFHIPIFSYHVSGEYSMLKAASLNGWLNFDKTLIESLLGFKRAGANGILTYAAIEAAKLIRKANK
jgi:porphobilinogen synthase